MKRLFFERLKYNPISPLLRCDDPAVRIFAAHEFLGDEIPGPELLALPTVSKILAHQRRNGSWEYPAPNLRNRSRENYNQLETYRKLGILVEQFGLDKNHPAIRKAATYLFSFQTKTGDFRGIYGNQYSPNYSAGITELLIKAGYGNDARIARVFRWLLSIRHADGGWAIPFRTRGYKTNVIYTRAKTIEPDLAKPFSAMVTGVVLRAFAAHSQYMHNKATLPAGRLLLSALFTKDNYPDRSGKESWTRFSFPFWFTDLVSALDTLSRLRFSSTEPGIERALNWLAGHQQKDGLWKLKILKGRNRDVLELYLALKICIIFKRFAMTNVNPTSDQHQAPK